jgi:hypothetical protein
MAIISEMEKKQYLQKFKWAITYSDGDVTTHKMLDFANQRTGKDVPYKPTIKAMLTMFFGFIFVTAIAALIYLKLKFIWTHWLVWFVGVLVISLSCRPFTSHAFLELFMILSTMFRSLGGTKIQGKWWFSLEA